jgi:hypothetical protein
VEAKLNTVNMTAWVHKECDIMEEEALAKLQEDDVVFYLFL